MKLYTEEEIRKFLFNHDESFFNKFTPIELPSDEEIEEEAESISKGYKALGLYSEDYYDGFTEGAKWVIEQIKQQDNA